jgi:hypothetical protein
LQVDFWFWHERTHSVIWPVSVVLEQRAQATFDFGIDSELEILTVMANFVLWRARKKTGVAKISPRSGAHERVLRGDLNS